MTTLLIVDPQNDFIDTLKGALGVPGAYTDMVELTSFINEKGDQIDKIVVPLDQHPHHHIAHPMMWIDSKGENPAPFTTITYADIEAGHWRASLLSNETIQHDYVREVEAVGGLLTIWPPHCIIGSWGAEICPMLCWDLKHWTTPTRYVEFFPKSGNWSTEQYSSFKAAVPREDDPSTMFNVRLYNAIQDDLILVAGEALGHCVAATMRDAMYYRPQDNLASRMVLLRNCTSPVTGSEAAAEAFVEEFILAGGRVMTTGEVLPVDYGDC